MSPDSLLPIAIYAVIACLAKWMIRSQVSTLLALVICSYCGVILFSFTGGSSGGIWLVQLALLASFFLLFRKSKSAGFPPHPVFKAMRRLWIIYIAGVVVAYFRYDMSTEMANADLARTLPFPLQFLMTGYRLFILVTLAVAMFLPFRFAISRADMARILTTCWVFSVVIAVCGILDYFGIADLAYSYRRVAGYKHVSILGFHRGALGMITVYGIFLSVACFFIHTQKTIRRAVGFFLPLQFAGLALSWSRAAVLALGFASLVILFFPRVRHRGRLLVGLGLAAGLLVLSFGLDDELYQRLFFFSTGYKDTSLGTRVQTWQSLGAVITEDPTILLAGCGFGNFSYYFHAGIEAVGLEVAHNNFMHVLSECGIFGLLAFIAWMIAVLQWAVRCQRYLKDPVALAVHLCFVAISVAAMVSCFSQESLTPANATVPLVLHFFLVQGIWIAWTRTETDRQMQAEGNLFAGRPLYPSPRERSRHYA